METNQTPLLVLHGTADKVTPPAGSQQLYNRAGSHDRTLKMYHGLYHDLLHEPESWRVSRDILDWIEARSPRR
jgi:lysophospholipase